METSNITRIIQSAYSRRYRMDDYQVIPRYRYYLAAIFNSIRSRKAMIISLIVLCAFIGASVYYYNMLITTEQDVLAATGKVNALLQRRNDLSINLSQAAFDYSVHERNVLTGIVGIRTLISKNKGDDSGSLAAIMNEYKQGKSAAAAENDLVQKQAAKSKMAIDPSAALARLMAVAEQYPDLKLSATFQNLMTAIIEVEKDLADERIKLNDAINIYTTNRAQFPTNVYAYLFSFKDCPYYEATPDAKEFRPITY
ncbi:magnetosomen protein MamQ [Candidatus Magnetomorum sp. HK-1]|nr:magnetosomen protein MamQ [Candidatus Magnetomorum sp. HK-1]